MNIIQIILASFLCYCFVVINANIVYTRYVKKIPSQSGNGNEDVIVKEVFLTKLRPPQYGNSREIDSFLKMDADIPINCTNPKYRPRWHCAPKRSAKKIKTAKLIDFNMTKYEGNSKHSEIYDQKIDIKDTDMVWIDAKRDKNGNDDNESFLNSSENENMTVLSRGIFDVQISCLPGERLDRYDRCRPISK